MATNNKFIVERTNVLSADVTLGVAYAALDSGDFGFYGKAGETYEFEGQAVRASSPISRQKTATMITQEWEAAYNAAEENNVPVPAANEEMGLDVGFVKRHLTSYSHFDPKNIRNNQVLDRNKVIVVLDDNINKCSTYAEVNKILKTLDQTKNAQIKWIVGILGTKASKDCFKNAD